MPGKGLLAPEPPEGPTREALGGWLLVLALLLTVGEPLVLAPEVARLLPTLATRDPSVAVLLTVRVLVTGFGVSAGLAIFARRPHAAGMATLALTLLGGVSLLAMLTPILPSNRLPGTTAPAALAVLVYYAAWMVYLRRSRRVRETLC